MTNKWCASDPAEWGTDLCIRANSSTDIPGSNTAEHPTAEPSRPALDYLSAAVNKLEWAGTEGQVPAPSSCSSSVEAETVVEGVEVRPETDALPVHEDNSIENMQSEKDKVAENSDALEEATPYRCHEVDVVMEDSAAEGAGEASDQMMGGNEPSRTRMEVPYVNGSHVLGEFQGLEVTYTVENGVSDTIVNPQVYKRIPEDVWPKLFQAGQWVKGAGGEPIKIWRQAPFNLQLGPVSLQRVLTVAEIED